MTAPEPTPSSRAGPSSVTAAVVVGMLNLVLTISLAALVFAEFSGPLLSQGIGLALTSAVVAGVAIALFSSMPGMVGSVQDASSAVLAVAAAGAVALMPAGAGAEQSFATVVVANGLTALVVGAFVLIVGVFGLGRLVRFLPYPVVGGFLAGMGWLVLSGAVGVMADVPADLASVGVLLRPSMLTLWLPGVIYAALLLIVTERVRSPLMWPALLVGAIVVFYAAMAVGGGSIAGWREAGHLPAAFDRVSLMTVFDYGRIGTVHWPAVWSYAPTAIALCVIVAISVLFNTTALELVTQDDLDLDQELRAAGATNVLVAGLGGLIGYQMLGDSTVIRQVGRGTRAEALGSVGVVALGLVVGGWFVPLLPKFLIGGFLAYIGLLFLRDWLVDTYEAVTFIEYAIIVLILVVIASVGFLEGVAVGILATVVLFVVDYGRADVVKHEQTGATARSRVARTPAEVDVLDAQAGAAYVLELQGFVFFGTANGLVERVRSRLREHPDTRFVLLDFRRVSGVDATARLAFEKLGRAARKHDVRLILSHLAPDVARKLEVVRNDPELGGAIGVTPTLDAALEACEEQLLAAADLETTPDGLVAVLARELGDEAAARRVLDAFESAWYDAGDALIRQGDAPDVLYFVAEGRVTAQLERDGGEPLRLETMAGGSLIGELGFYTGAERSASVVADEPVIAHRLTREALERLKREDPEVATAFTELVVRLLAKRTGHLMRVVDALQR